LLNYKVVLAIDPSGNFYEGKGTTGFCCLQVNEQKILSTKHITAKDYRRMEAYWHEHLKIIKKYIDKHKDVIVVIEDYLLYASKANTQVNSKMETPKLIGTLQHFCWMKGIPLIMQTASQVKNRWTDELLVHKGLISQKNRFYYVAGTDYKINKHCRDAIRHAMHYANFTRKKKRS